MPNVDNVQFSFFLYILYYH